MKTHKIPDRQFLCRQRKATSVDVFFLVPSLPSILMVTALLLKVIQSSIDTLTRLVAVFSAPNPLAPFQATWPCYRAQGLRYIKAALRCAEEWEYIARALRIKMLREPEKLPRCVTPEHFATIYSKGCKVATRPDPNHPACRGQNYQPEDWWKALVVFLYMTGWRIDSALSLRWEDIDFEEGTAFSHYDDNKGKRDQLIQLHPIVLEHLERIRGFGSLVFFWPYDTTVLYKQFRLIQEAPVDRKKKRIINLPCREKHEHTPSCYVYGFHDFRRAFATANAETLSADALQRLMQHKSYLTTQRYINMAHQVKQAAGRLHVPDVLKRGAG